MPAGQRLRRAAIASDIVALADAATDGAPAARHAARLARVLAGRPRRATTIADIDAAPAWLRAASPVRADLGRRAALVLTAPHLARSIDGPRLKALADSIGVAALDHVIALGSDRDPSDASDLVLDQLAATGAAILAASLPPALADLLPPVSPFDAERAAALVAEAQQVPA